MKKIINRRKYDTETATWIANYSNHLGARNFRNFSESLYRKRNGEYFICGEGGPLTRWARPCGIRTWTGGSGIIPVSEEEAKEWAENVMSADAYEKVFGPVEE